MNKCPRCINGFVVSQWNSDGADSMYCLSCGHELIEIPQDVLAEIRESYGKARLSGSAHGNHNRA